MSRRPDPAHLAGVRARLGTLSVPADLPIAARADEIIDLLSRHSVLVVAGETGSGKSTQLAKLALRAGAGHSGRIAHTQPRRVAARAIARRVAEECGVPLGTAVGYKVRFGDRTAPDTLIKVLTDGMLLAEYAADPTLGEYDTVIVDEAHERSLNIDLLLGCLVRLRARRPDLRLIVTSATLDVERMAAHLGGAPVVSVAGRLHPVEVRWRPGEEGSDLAEQVRAAVAEGLADHGGDVLVFLPGEREIHECSAALTGSGRTPLEVLPLYARLGSAEQDRVFSPGPARRVVLATNVAETALTVPRIGVVVDAGLARIARYSPRAKVQRLPIEPVSQASAVQRAGRCGRLGPGLCLRLYAEDDFLARPAFTPPEIQRTNLAAVLLQMAVLGLGAAADFPWLDAPDGRAVREGLRLLTTLGALAADGRLTPRGRHMARLPIDPRFARMLLAAGERGCAADMLVIVSALSVSDPRLRPPGEEAAAEAAHAAWRDPRSDFVALLRLWQAWQGMKEQSRSRQRAWCRQNYLSGQRLREWGDIHSQLAGALGQDGPVASGDGAALHECLLTGLLDHVGQRLEAREYLGARGLRFHAFPGTGLAPLPRWLVAAELVETRRVYARTLARVEPDWIERAAGDELSVHHADPHWSVRSGRVESRVTVSLYGLTLASGRRGDYGRVDPAGARAILIREALVGDALGIELPCLTHTRAARAARRLAEAKLRQQDTLLDAAAVGRAFDARLPASVHDRKGLLAWYAAARRDGAEPLRLGAAELGPLPDLAAYPDNLVVADVALPLRYRYAPGEADDGLTLEVPLAMLLQLDAAVLAWSVPGWRAELISTLVRGLPKDLRRQLVPAPALAAGLLATDLDPGRALGPELSRAVQALRGVRVPASAWDLAALPAHLRLRISVHDAQGREVDADRDLAALQARLTERVHAVVAAQASTAWPAREFRTADLPDIPERVTTDRDGRREVSFPALADRGQAVVAVLAADRSAARRQTAAAFARLARLTLDREQRYLMRHGAGMDALCLRLKPLAPAEAWRQDLADAALAACLDVQDPALRRAGVLAARCAEVRTLVVPTGTALIAEWARIAEAWAAARQAVAGLTGTALAVTRADLETQLADLVYPGCLAATPAAARPHLERYLKGARQRAEKAGNMPAADRSKLAELEPFLRRFAALRGGRALGDLPPDLAALRWLLEEQRIASFAQALRTAQPVSTQRLARAFESLSPAE